MKSQFTPLLYSRRLNNNPSHNTIHSPGHRLWSLMWPGSPLPSWAHLLAFSWYSELAPLTLLFLKDATHICTPEPLYFVNSLPGMPRNVQSLPSHFIQVSSQLAPWYHSRNSTPIYPLLLVALCSLTLLQSSSYQLSHLTYVFGYVCSLPLKKKSFFALKNSR